MVKEYAAAIVALTGVSMFNELVAFVFEFCGARQPTDQPSPRLSLHQQQQYVNAWGARNTHTRHRFCVFSCGITLRPIHSCMELAVVTNIQQRSLTSILKDSHGAENPACSRDLDMEGAQLWA